jgi:golgi phosphoprotein 3
MASAGGLTRRRGGRVGEEDSSRVSSPTRRNGTTSDSRTPETSFTDGENGHKIAFDPRDISENEERSRQPKLTLMEEVLLLGLKDKQVHIAMRDALEPTILNHFSL